MTGNNRPLWQLAAGKAYAPLEGDCECDVVIIGAGITGLTAAHVLKKAGKRVRVLEQAQVAAGTSGMSSAHLTTLFDSTMYKVETTVDTDHARAIHRAMQNAIDRIQGVIAGNSIHCQFERLDGYYYSEKGQDSSEIERELRAARHAGMEVEDERPSALPMEIERGFKVPGQAMFNPVAYLQGLARVVHGGDCHIHENTRVMDYFDGSPCGVQTNRGTVRAESVIMATHTPLGRTLLHTVLEAYRSYIIVCRIDGVVPNGLYWDALEEYHYLRPVRWNNEVLLMVGGADHKTGNHPEENPYDTLEEYIRSRFRVKEVVSRWSAQYYESVDQVPMVGKIPPMRNIYTATGFNGDGLTLGTAAGAALGELLSTGSSKFVEMFDPSRFNARALPKFATMNLDVAKHFVMDRLGAEDKNALQALRSGEGLVIRSGGKSYACFKNEDGSIEQKSATCPHMGCIVQWNPFEKTWDCPCHGGRFCPNGTRLEGPPRADLGDEERVDHHAT